MATTIPARIAGAQLISLLEQVSREKQRFVITKSGKPVAVLLSISEFDDILEELDPEFRKSLRIAAEEYQKGKVVPLRDYLKARHRTRKRTPCSASYPKNHNKRRKAHG